MMKSLSGVAEWLSLCLLSPQEMETSDKLRLNLKQQEMLVEQLRKRLDSSQQKLEIEEAKKPSTSSLETKGWKSMVVTRMYEEKVKGMEEELHKKVRGVTPSLFEGHTSDWKVMLSLEGH